MIMYNANLSDAEFDKILGEDSNDSSDYEPLDNSSDSENEVVSESEDNGELEIDPEPCSQATASNENDNLWVEIQQYPELFISQESTSVKFDTSTFVANETLYLSIHSALLEQEQAI